MTAVRRLNEEGLLRMVEFLDRLTTESPLAIPSQILDDSETSKPIDPGVEVEKREFFTRFEAAEYLNRQLDPIDEFALQRDRGLWAWLALFYFEQLCPADDDGRRKPGQKEKWVLAADDFRTYYRHLLAGPFRIYRAHRDDPARCLAVLANPLHTPGEVAEQLVSRQELVTSETVMSTATRLYVEGGGAIKRGAAGKGGGSARRLAEVLNQFDVNWDLHIMTPEELLAMLPAEFDRFRSGDGG